MLRVREMSLSIVKKCYNSLSRVIAGNISYKGYASVYYGVKQVMNPLKKKKKVSKKFYKYFKKPETFS